MNTPLASYCSGFPAADALAEHIEYARNLGYHDRPDYAHLARLYTGALEQYGVARGGPYDWVQRDEDATMAGEKAHYNSKASSPSGPGGAAASPSSADASDYGIPPGGRRKEKG